MHTVYTQAVCTQNDWGPGSITMSTVYTQATHSLPPVTSGIHNHSPGAQSLSVRTTSFHRKICTDIGWAPQPGRIRTPVMIGNLMVGTFD